MASSAPDNLLERDHALAQLDALSNQAAEGHGTLVFVSGEAGIGKTALLTAFRARAGSRASFWWGHCDALQTPSPLAPLRDMQGQMPPALREQLRSGGPRIELFAAFLDAISARPTIVVFEDVHWADDATRDLLRYLGRRVPRTPALVIATHRDDELGPAHPLRVVLGDLATSGARRLVLEPLSFEAVQRLVEDHQLDAAEVHRLCGGNPFLVTEVAGASGQGAAHGVPANVRDAVLARSARLGESARSVLETAAVAGARVDLTLLRRLAGAESAGIDECVTAGVLRRDGDRVMFRHELIREALQASLPPGRRGALHRLALQALSPAARDADLAQLAHHAEGARDADAVLDFAPRAAAQASGAGAHREAAAQYERALRFAATARLERRAELLEACAIEHLAVGRLDAAVAERRQAAAIWQECGKPARIGANLARLVPLLVNASRNDEAERASRDAIDLLQAMPPTPELALALRAQAYLRMISRDLDEAVRFGDEAIALAESFGDLDTLALACNATGSALMFSDHERGRALLRRSQALALQAGNDVAAQSALTNLGSASGEVHRFVEAAACLEEAAAFAGERELDSSYELAWLALCRLRLGQWDQAGELAEQARAMNAERAISLNMAWLATGRLRARRGDPGAWEALDAALRLAQASGHLQRLAPVHGARAEAAWLAGESGRALDEASAVFDLARSRKHAWFVGELAFWRWRASGQPVDGDAAPPYALQIHGDWRAAAASWEALACPYEQAGALADGDEAAQHEALAMYDRLGAQPAARRLREAMRKQGLRAIPRGPRASTQANAFGLTARELEILALLAEGLTNAQVGARRHISVRTVDHHVAAILAKLGVESRADAVQRGRLAGLLAAAPR